MKAIYDHDAEETIEQVHNLAAIQLQRQETLPLPWTVMEAEFILDQHHRDVTLDQILANEVEPPFRERERIYDRCIWRGTRIVAVVQTDTGGKPKIVRLLPPRKART